MAYKIIACDHSKNQNSLTIPTLQILALRSFLLDHDKNGPRTELGLLLPIEIDGCTPHFFESFNTLLNLKNPFKSSYTLQVLRAFNLYKNHLGRDFHTKYNAHIGEHVKVLVSDSIRDQLGANGISEFLTHMAQQGKTDQFGYPYQPLALIVDDILIQIIHTETFLSHLKAFTQSILNGKLTIDSDQYHDLLEELFRHPADPNDYDGIRKMYNKMHPHVHLYFFKKTVQTLTHVLCFEKDFILMNVLESAFIKYGIFSNFLQITALKDAPLFTR